MHDQKELSSLTAKTPRQGFKTVNGKKACTTAYAGDPIFVDLTNMTGFKTVNGKEACTTIAEATGEAADELVEFQNRKR